MAGAENQTRTLIAACIKQTGADVLQHIGTDEAVNDLNAIRHALGEPGLTAVAYSYGTKVAALMPNVFRRKRARWCSTGWWIWRKTISPSG